METQQLQEISAEQLLQWRQHPVSLRFFQYLRDYRAQIGDTIAASIATGSPIDHAYSDTAALRCEIMLDLEEIAVDDINHFYNPPTEKEEKEDGDTVTDKKTA